MQQLVWFDSGVNSCQGQSQACLHTWLPQEEKHLYSIRCTLFLGKIWLGQNKQSVIEKYTKEEKRQQEKKKAWESFKRDKSRGNNLKGKFEYCKKKIKEITNQKIQPNNFSFNITKNSFW